MASRPQSLLKPRKRPVQARSEATVAALFEASIQVLLAVGYRKLTTTRVADGRRVGRHALPVFSQSAGSDHVRDRAVPDDLVCSIERSCQDLNGRPLEELATGLVDAFIAAKWMRIKVSRAMHSRLRNLAMRSS